MNRLWVRLALAFGAVTVTGVIIAALLANLQVSAQFRRFVVVNQMASFIEPELINYYAARGNWAGVESVFDNLPGRGGMMGRGSGFGPGMPHGGPPLVLADASGRVVYSRPQRDESAQLSSREINSALPLVWQGDTIGYLLGTPPQIAELAEPAQTFLVQTNRALLQAGLIAGTLGLLIGIAVAWGLSAPLRRLAAAARRISTGQLDQRVPEKGADEVANLARAFNEMAASLQQSETLRRNLVADVAHELRTPLTVIQGNLRAILDDVYPLDKSEIATIYDETLTLSRLVQDLRELTQAEAGQLGLNLRPTDVGALVRGTADLFGELTRQKQVELKAQLPASLPAVQADPERVRQILQNLLANALRHTPAGGQVTMTAHQPDTSFIRVSVSDTGPGISPQDLPHVFDRFWRADKSRSREQGGSGLGLAIAKQLAQAHGGQIGAESTGRPGQGSCFWFTLPLAR